MINGKPFRYQTKKALVGFLFVLPWFIGFIVFFLRPLASSLLFSFGDVTISTEGLSTGITGFENYHRAFVIDGEFIPSLTGSIGNMLYELPIIVIFSLFVAYLLNAKFRGRTFVRAVFFLPVIVTTGIIIEILAGDPVAQEMFSMEQQSALLQAEVLEAMLLEAGIPPAALGSGIRSGLFIYIFNQFFRGMPRELEDAAHIDGCGFSQTFVWVFVPNSVPAFLTVFFFSFVWYWNDYFFSSMFFSSINTMSTKLAQFETAVLQLANDPTMNPFKFIVGEQAAALLTIGPVLIMYIFLQRHFTESVERTGIVG